MKIDIERSRGDARQAASQTISHVNLHYRRPEDGPIAARLLELVGLQRTQHIPLAVGDFYRFSANRQDLNRGDGIVYLGRLPEPAARLADLVRETFSAGQADEHPAVTAVRAAQASDPEVNFHVGFLFGSLEEMEQRIAVLQQAAMTDPELKGRIQLVFNRAAPGVTEVDARLDASPVYRDVTRRTFGYNGVQAFVQTDLVVAGPLADGISLELDYVFPGYDRHILSVSEMTR